MQLWFSLRKIIIHISKMSKLTIGEAAKLYNLTRGSIYDRINSGSLSTSLNERGHKVVDIASLISIYGEPTRQHVQQPPQQKPTEPDTIELYRKLLESADRRADKAEQREDRLFNEITALREEVRELRLALGYTPKQENNVMTDHPTTPDIQAIQAKPTETYNSPTTKKETGGEGKKTPQKKGLLGRFLGAVFED